MRRKWLIRLAWGAGVVLVVLLVLGTAVLLSLDSILRWQIRTSMERQIGTGVRLDHARLGLLDGSLELRSLVVSNPPGFGPLPLISIPELYLRYDPAGAVSNRLNLAEVRLHLEELNVVIDAQGRPSSIPLSGDSPSAENLLTNLWPKLQIGGIDRLTLTLGRLSVIHQRDPRKNFVLNLALTNQTYTNLDSPLKLLLLASEIALRGGLESGVPKLPKPTNAPSFR